MTPPTRARVALTAKTRASICFRQPRSCCLERPSRTCSRRSRGEARYGVVPIENTLAGSIHACYDLLFEHDLKIVGETVRHILFQLIAPPGVALTEVRKALSHPVALAQCEKFFRQHTAIQPVPVYDTAGAVEIVIKQGDRDAAAIATRRAAEVYGGVIVAEAIQDHLENYTRFLLITPASAPGPAVSTNSDYKTTIVFSVGNAPARYITRCGLLPSGVSIWPKLRAGLYGDPRLSTCFIWTLSARADSTPIADALGELKAQAKTLRVLGTYPRYKG